MAKSFDKMTKDELLEYKKEVEQKLKEKEEAELLIANQCKQHLTIAICPPDEGLTYELTNGYYLSSVIHFLIQ